jgi:hypothetical protein
VYLYFGGRGEVTLARRSSLEGVHGGVDVGCRVAKGIFEGPGRVPCLESVAEPLYVSIRIFPSMYGRRVVHLRSVSDGVCGAILWVMVVERGGDPGRFAPPRSHVISCVQRLCILGSPDISLALLLFSRESLVSVAMYRWGTYW